MNEITDRDGILHKIADLVPAADEMATTLRAGGLPASAGNVEVLADTIAALDAYIARLTAALDSIARHGTKLKANTLADQQSYAARQALRPVKPEPGS